MSFFSNLLSKVKGPKSSDDFDDNFGIDDDIDDDMEEEGGVPAPSAMREEDDDYDDDFGDALSKKTGLSKKKKILIAGSTAAVLAIGGGYWFVFSDADNLEAERSDRTTASLAIGQPQSGGLTPQQATGAAVTSKLVSGAATATGAAPRAATGKLTASNAPAPATKLAAQNTAPKLAAAAATTISPTVGGGMGGYDPKNSETPFSTAASAEIGISIPAILPNAVANMGTKQKANPLRPPADDSLFETISIGKLPVISPSGAEPWKTYARPFNVPAGTPLVGIVVTGLGLSNSLTQAAIDHLPHDVTLSFSPYGSDIQNWVNKARAQGHEVLLELPMESNSFPVDDPGPLSVTTSKGMAENLKLLNQLMSQAQGYIGFVGQHGSAFTQSKKSLAPVLGELKTRGLFFMDPKSADKTLSLTIADQIHLSRAIADKNINVNVSSEQMRAQLDTLAAIAANKKITAAIIPATPASIKTIMDWAQKLQSVRIAPMSSIAGRQPS